MLKFDGQKLRQIRIERDLTLDSLSLQIFGKECASRVSNYEHGRSTPNADILLNLLDVLDAKASDIASEA